MAPLQEETMFDLQRFCVTSCSLVGAFEESIERSASEDGGI
jgi:hypothetical protein